MRVQTPRSEAQTPEVVWESRLLMNPEVGLLSSMREPCCRGRGARAFCASECSYNLLAQSPLCPASAPPVASSRFAQSFSMGPQILWPPKLQTTSLGPRQPKPQPRARSSLYEEAIDQTCTWRSDRVCTAASMPASGDQRGDPEAGTLRDPKPEINAFLNSTLSFLNTESQFQTQQA